MESGTVDGRYVYRMPRTFIGRRLACCCGWCLLCSSKPQLEINERSLGSCFVVVVLGELQLPHDDLPIRPHRPVALGPSPESHCK
jgi:hypothetical protein